MNRFCLKQDQDLKALALPPHPLDPQSAPPPPPPTPITHKQTHTHTQTIPLAPPWGKNKVISHSSSHIINIMTKILTIYHYILQL